MVRIKPAGHLIRDVAHIAQDLRNRSLPRGSGLEFNDDDCALRILCGYVDEPRCNRTFRSIVDDLQAGFELFNGATQGSLQIPFESNELTALVFRTVNPGTVLFALRFPPEFTVSFSRIPVRGQIVSGVAVERDFGCFRNPVLLSSHGGDQVFPLRGIGVNDEHTNGPDQAQKVRDGRENITERQPLWGQGCLHRRRSDFAPELQSPMGSEEIVMASQQLQMIVQPLCSPSVTDDFRWEAMPSIG